MANTFTLTSSSTYDGRKMVLTCTQTQDVDKNISTISWKLETIGGNDSYYYTGPTTLTINGVQVYYRKRTGAHEFPCAKGSTSGTLTVVHDADGKKNISVSLTTAIYYGSSYAKTNSGTWTLDTIPRAATLNSATNFTDEENPTITYSNPAGNNATTLETYIYADDEKTVLVGAKNLTKTNTSFTYNLTNAERAKLRSAATTNTLKVKFRIKTVIGSVTYWSSWITKTMTIVNANPIAQMTVIDNNPDTIKLTGNNNSIVKGYSAALYTISATAQKGATISSYNVANGSAKATAASNSFLNATSNVFKYTVTDSRGNKTTGTVNKTLINYVELTVNQKVQMTLVGETGVTMAVNVSGNYFNGSFGAVANTLDVYYRIATDSGDYGNWEPISVDIVGNYYSSSFNITGLSYEKSYKIQTKAKDKLNEIKITPYVSKLKPIFDWGENDFNFNCEIKVNNVSLIDIIYPVGSIYMSVNNVSPNVFFGGEWEQIKDTFLLAAGTAYRAGDAGGEATHTLIANELPELSGTAIFRDIINETSNPIRGATGIFSRTTSTWDGSHSAFSTELKDSGYTNNILNINIGGGASHNNMPPYLAVYMWKRIS